MRFSANISFQSSMSAIQAYLLFLALPSAPITIYVTPTAQTKCPAEPCHTLAQYAEEDAKYLVSNTTMVFLPGVIP